MQGITALVDAHSLRGCCILPSLRLRWLRAVRWTCRDIVPLGSKRSKFNYNLDEKRVLNFENVVNDDDNIKQDMSIDVYGRKAEDDDQPQDGAAEVRLTPACRSA